MILVVLVLAGCNAGGTDSAPSRAEDLRAATASPAPATGSDPGPEGVDLTEVVPSIEVAPSDLPAGYGPNMMQKGDEVENQVTLDLCDGSFPSEALRTARHQVAYPFGDPESPSYDATADGAAVMSEVVSYTAGGAEQAMQELRTAVATCPRHYVDARVAGIGRTRTTFSTIPSAGDWQADHLAVVAHLRLETGESFRMALIYQRRGDLLGMAYVTTTESGRGTTLASEMASVLSRQLEAVADPAAADPAA